MRKIRWEWWIDPFLSNIDEVKHLIDEDDDSPPTEQKSTSPCICGPFGIIPITESNAPSKLYNFWIGHCNFDLTPPVENLISSVAGVEIYNTYSRYRFRIAIGKAFESDEVKQSIERVVCQTKPDKAQNIEFLRNHLSSRFTHWAICIMSDGNMQLAYNNDHDVVVKKMEDFPQGSEIYTSWD